jgi:hypothetical protein
MLGRNVLIAALWPALLTLRADRNYTLTMTTAEMNQMLEAQLFTQGGRAYPCKNNPACSAWGDDLAMSHPAISVDGPRVLLTTHVDGTYPINQFFAPQIAGDLTIAAIPVIVGGLVHLTQAQITANPASDMTFRAFIVAFHTNMENVIDQRGVFDLASYLASASRNTNLPPPRIPDLTCLDPAQIAVERIGTQSDPAALTAAVTVHLPQGHPAQRKPPC